jgi:acetylornithine deacetylase/succinyl-diaminopimelate desuccinylase-like protein
MEIKVPGLFLTLLLLVPLGARSENRKPRIENRNPAADVVLEQVRTWRQAEAHRIVDELVEFLSLPNVATSPDDIWRNAEWLAEKMEQRGIRTEVVKTSGSPVVYGELLASGATRTILFYCHYDGQAVDPTKWINSQPFQPVLRRGVAGDWSTIPFPAAGQTFQDNWRVYARSAADDKSPIVALLAALDALRAQKLAPRVNLKFVFDGEEEQGSPYLDQFIERYRERLQADVVIIADGPVHPSERPTIFFGNRGIMTLDITLYGPRVPLHSGHYGNWAPNPAMRLAQLLATMKDAEGKVLIEGFYDDVLPLTASDQEAIAAIPNLDAELRQRYGIAQPEGGGRRLDELIQLPSLNVRGLESAWVGDGARTIVPATATAAIDVRLVTGTDHERVFQRIVAHIRRQGYHVVEQEPTEEERRTQVRIARVVKREGYNAVRTPLDVPVARVLAAALERAAGAGVVKLPTLGGSGPSHLFEGLGIPVIGVPIVNFDNNQHSPNENLRLGHFWRGIEIFAAILLAE